MICEQNQGITVYWKVLDTGEIFQNRKEAKEKLGHYYFDKLWKTGKIKFFSKPKED